MRRRVFIACPISRGDLRENIRQAREASSALMRAGLAPLNPALSCFAQSDTPSRAAGFTHAEWLEVSLPWLAWAEAVLRLPGESRGADKECALAENLGIPVFGSVPDVLAHFAEAARA